MIEILLILIFTTCFILNLWKLLSYYDIFSVLIHPLTIISCYFILFYFFPAFSELLYIPAVFKERFSFSSAEISYTIGLIVFVYAILTLYFLFRKLKNKKNIKIYDPQKKFLRKKDNFIIENYILLYIALLLFIFFILCAKFGGIVAVFNNYTNFVMSVRNGNSGLLYIIYTAELIPIFYLMFSKKVNKFFFTFIFLFSIFMVAFTGARILLITILIQIYLILLIKKSINWKSISVFLLTFLLIFTLMSVMRSTYSFGDTRSINQTWLDLKGYWTRNMDQFINTLIVIEEIKERNVDFQYGKTLIDAVFFLTPSQIYPEKPRSYYPSRLIYGDVAASSGQTFNFGIIGRSYLECGLLGVIVFNILSFMLFLFIFERFIKTKNQCNNIEKTSPHFSFSDFILIYIYSHILQVYVLGFSSHVWSYFLLFIIFLFFFFLGYKVFRSFIIGAIRGDYRY